jgi:hypothetical protein
MEAWIQENTLLFVLLLVWTLFWKGKALWKSAQLNQKYWFVVLLIVNTFGLLEIFYLFLINRDEGSEVVEN